MSDDSGKGRRRSTRKKPQENSKEIENSIKPKRSRKRKDYKESKSESESSDAPKRKKRKPKGQTAKIVNILILKRKSLKQKERLRVMNL